MPTGVSWTGSEYTRSALLELRKPARKLKRAEVEGRVE